MPLYSGRGHIPGSAAADDASAGEIGEQIISLAPSGTATVTITIASPGVITWSGHTIRGIVAVSFTTTTTLPTGIVSGTIYYTLASTAPGNTFQIATTIANAIAGTAINTSGSQAGTHTGSQNTALSTNTPLNLAAVNLTAGDWDIEGSSYMQAAGTTVVTASFLSINSVSATLDVNTGNFAGGNPSTAGVTGISSALVLPRRRISLAATTVYYLVGQAAFSSSTLAAAGGLLRARRVR